MHMHMHDSMHILLEHHQLECECACMSTAVHSVPSLKFECANEYKQIWKPTHPNKIMTKANGKKEISLHLKLRPGEIFYWLHGYCLA